ncbi:unnamed protein product [Symbiodinium natans]|uniref:Cyclin N-terminal domain-containing protein n=1 Tax=Symbiodinium natans TaxID=878477 RepID=A0A812S730_9DINO|nr:unnamed protein product [Symbiodinium natans]
MARLDTFGQHKRTMAMAMPNLSIVPGPQPQVQQPLRRNAAVLGDITNTGYAVKVDKPAFAPARPRAYDESQAFGPGNTTVAWVRENSRFVIPVSGDHMDVVMEEEEDPQQVSEYSKDIFERMFSMERSFQPRCHFLAEQREINTKMRAILVDWLVEVHMKYRLKPETLFMAVNVIDRYLSMRQVARKKLQLCGVTALLIASKFEEIYPPEVKDFVYITDNAYTKDDILRMEVSILSTLNFELCGPTAAHFLDRYQRANKCSEEHAHLMQYLAELCLLEVHMVQYVPSLVAAASALLSNKLLRQHPAWPPCLAQITQTHSEAEVKACAREMCGLLDSVEKSSLQAIRKKYSQEKFSKIATTGRRFWTQS